MTRITQKAFIQDDPLSAAVIRQMGGWQSFTESAQDIANHGVDGGFHGFIYYTETTKFARKNLPAIREALDELGDNMGSSTVQLVKGFKYLKDYSENEIAEVLYRGKSSDEDAETAVLNSLAWYAAERAALAYVDRFDNP